MYKQLHHHKLQNYTSHQTKVSKVWNLPTHPSPLPIPSLPSLPPPSPPPCYLDEAPSRIEIAHNKQQREEADGEGEEDVTHILGVGELLQVEGGHELGMHLECHCSRAHLQYGVYVRIYTNCKNIQTHTQAPSMLGRAGSNPFFVKMA